MFTRLIIAVWLTYGLIVVLLMAPEDWDDFLVDVAPEMLKAAIVVGVVWFAPPVVFVAVASVLTVRLDP